MPLRRSPDGLIGRSVGDHRFDLAIDGCGHKFGYLAAVAATNDRSMLSSCQSPCPDLIRIKVGAPAATASSGLSIARASCGCGRPPAKFACRILANLAHLGAGIGGHEYVAAGRNPACAAFITSATNWLNARVRDLRAAGGDAPGSDRNSTIASSRRSSRRAAALRCRRRGRPPARQQCLTVSSSGRSFTPGPRG